MTEPPESVGSLPPTEPVVDEQVVDTEPSTSAPDGIARGTRDEWIAAVDRRDAGKVLTATTYIAGPTATMSQAFHVGADDGEEYWIKTLQGVDPQYRPSVAAEQVIARVGALLGIAVVQPYLVAVPTGMTLPPLRDGTRVQPGVAHATRAHASCTEDKNIPQRLTEDDNRRRHVGVWALVDLARGADLQYLYDASAANAIISHDHGLYACGTGGLDVAIMVATVSTPGQAPPDASGLDQAEVDLMATRLEGLADDSIGDILNLVPTAWPVTNEQLGTLGWFLSQRAPEVAVRLRALAPKGGS